MADTTGSPGQDLTLGPNILFLFGSGLSIPAKFPSTEELSARIIGVENLCYETSKEFSIRPPDERSTQVDPFVPVRVLALLTQIKAEVDAYDPSRRSNYEDWFYLAHQLHSALSGDYDNPALFEFIYRLKQRFTTPPTYFHEYGPSPESRLMDTAEQVMDFIRFMVIRQLSRTDFDTSYLSWIRDATRDRDVKIKGIFTLNHDLLLETYFKENLIDFSRGFEQPRFSSDVPGLHWNRDSVIDGDKWLLLAKLHGSIDWRDHEDRTGVPFGQRGRRSVYLMGEDQVAEGSKPLLLIGRHNKLYDYTNFVFEDLHYRFYRALRESTGLVVCGYGWGDKGINTRILNWRHSNPQNRLFIINGTNNPLGLTARPAMHNSMPEWEKDLTVLHIQKWAETVTWAEVKSAARDKALRFPQ